MRRLLKTYWNFVFLLEGVWMVLMKKKMREAKMLSCPQSTPTLLRVKPRTKWCHCSQTWSNNNILLLDDSIPWTKYITAYTPINSQHKLHQSEVHIWLPMGTELGSGVYKPTVVTTRLYRLSTNLNFYNTILIDLE